MIMHFMLSCCFPSTGLQSLWWCEMLLPGCFPVCSVLPTSPFLISQWRSFSHIRFVHLSFLSILSTCSCPGATDFQHCPVFLQQTLHFYSCMLSMLPWTLYSSTWQMSTSLTFQSPLLSQSVWDTSLGRHYSHGASFTFPLYSVYSSHSGLVTM